MDDKTEKCDREERIRKLSIRLNKQKENEVNQLTNWEVDDYYEKNLKKYDTE